MELVTTMPAEFTLSDGNGICHIRKELGLYVWVTPRKASSLRSGVFQTDMNPKYYP